MVGAPLAARPPGPVAAGHRPGSSRNRRTARLRARRRAVPVLAAAPEGAQRLAHRAARRRDRPGSGIPQPGSRPAMARGAGESPSVSTRAAGQGRRCPPRLGPPTRDRPGNLPDLVPVQLRHNRGGHRHHHRHRIRGGIASGRVHAWTAVNPCPPGRRSPTPAPPPAAAVCSGGDLPCCGDRLDEISPSRSPGCPAVPSRFSGSAARAAR